MEPAAFARIAHERQPREADLSVAQEWQAARIERPAA
jgi:hypothetical protein